MKKSSRLFFLLMVIAAVIAGCATQTTEAPDHLPGFFKGLIHGFILLFSFIASLFTYYEVYAFPNIDGWYDFGFLMGVMMFFGGGGASARKR